MLRKEFLENLMPITDEERQYIEGNGGIDRDIYMESMNNIVNSKKLLESGKIITMRQHPRFVHFPEHTHDYVEMVYMCSGETTHVINGEKIVLKAGEILFLSPNTRQEIMPASAEDIAINFIILPQFFDVSLDMIGEENTPLRSFIIQCLKGEGDNIKYLHFEVSDVLPIQNIVETLIWTLNNDASNKRKIKEFSMGLLFLHLLNYTDRLNHISEENDLAFKVLQYIENNYKDGSLTELSNILFYDLNSLSRTIKNRFGKNYTELVQEKRLSQACFLLRETDINIDTLAAQVGYDNKSYFHRIFKKKFALTPKEYREQNCK